MQRRQILANLTLLLIAPAPQAGGQQPTPVARIGVLTSGPQQPNGMKAFREALAELGWVEGRNLDNLAKPEGNVTGLVTIPVESGGKHVQLLKEAVPKISRLAYFVQTTASPFRRRFLRARIA